MSDRPAFWLDPITEEQRKPHGCLNCEAAGVIQVTFHPKALICAGFGMAALTKDGELVFDGSDIDGPEMTGAEAEALAAKEPDRDWRIQIEGPLSGRTYQRQGEANWVLVAQNEGFA
jgi:hypothetical protein